MQHPNYRRTALHNIKVVNQSEVQQAIYEQTLTELNRKKQAMEICPAIMTDGQQYIDLIENIRTYEQLHMIEQERIDKAENALYYRAITPLNLN